MAGNAIESDFRSSKMAAGSHFMKNKIKIKVSYWSEMARNVIESDGRRQPFCKTITVAYWYEMARNVIKSYFQSSKMATGSHFVKKKNSCLFIWNGEKCDRKWFSVIQNGCWQAFCEKKIEVAHWSEMVRNVIESDFRSSKIPMASL